MAIRKPGSSPTNGDIVMGSSLSTEKTERPNNWDTEDERDRQELAKYEKIEATIVKQLVVETNAMLAMLRLKPGCLCQMDRQFLRAKLKLMEAKLEASVMAEQQIVKIKSASRRRRGLQS